jgi:hypothetical protein
MMFNDKKSYKIAADRSAGGVALDEQIATGELTLRRLSLKRQLAEVRSQRKDAKEQHHKLVTYYHDRSIVDKRRYQSTINISSSLNAYINAAKGKYDVNPGRYVVRKHAQLLKIERSQELLESYAAIAQEQYEAIIQDLRETCQDMRLALHEEKCQMGATQYQIHEQMVAMVTAKVKAYYKSQRVNSTTTSKSAGAKQQRPYTPPTLIERLVTKKASERTCFMMATIAP